MNLDARAGRSWRRSRKKGVSPIIATILLVAITVVLAAVLYVLISGLTKGPGNTPLAGYFGFGTVTEQVGTASSPGCANTHICWSIPVGTASGGVTAGSMLFQIKDTSGNTHNFITVTLLSISSTVLAGWNLTAVTSGSSVSLSTTQTLVVDSGTTSDTYIGYTLLALGQGSFSGQVPTTLN